MQIKRAYFITYKHIFIVPGKYRELDISAVFSRTLAASITPYTADADTSCKKYEKRIIMD